MSSLLHLSIVTPSARLVDAPSVQSVRSEDQSGSFGILPGHADFLTVLVPTVVRWREQGEAHYCIVDGGVFTVRDGRDVAIACRQGKVGANVEELIEDVARMRMDALDASRRARVEEMRLHARAVRQLMRLMRGDGGAAPGGFAGAPHA